MKELLENALVKKDFQVRDKKLFFCKMCGKEEKRSNWRQIYCGSWKRKEGCSYINHTINAKKRMAVQRKLNPEKIEEQRKKWKNTDKGKSYNFRWKEKVGIEKVKEVQHNYNVSEKGKQRNRRYKIMLSSPNWK